MLQGIYRTKQKQQHCQRQKPPKSMLPHAANESAGGKCWLRRFDLVTQVLSFAIMLAAQFPIAA
jgi:hypothetical protein